MTEITAIGLFHCKAGSESEESETEVIQILEEDELDSFPNVREVTKSLVSTLKTRDFVGAKSARVHKFTSEAESPRGVSAVSTKDLLEELVERNSVRPNLETLASWYLQTDYAQSGLLIITHFVSRGGKDQIAIIKAPFVDDVYEPDDEKILSELDEVIKGDLKKGILYPRITPDGTEKWDEANVYQRESSQRYPKHWYEYLHLEPSKTSGELLADQFDNEEDSIPLEEAESTSEFEDILAEIDEPVEEAGVNVVIGGTKVKIPLGEILRRERIHLVKNGTGYHLIISGEKPKVTFFDHSSGQQREILKNLEEFDSFKKLE